MITVQIASIPERINTLRQTVDSLLPQVDYIFVACNGHEDVPSFLRGNSKISSVLLDNSTADCAKFYNIENMAGYLLFADDDIVYPKGYAAMMCEEMDKRKCIVTLHGRTYKRPLQSFYHIDKNYRCLGNVPHGAYVDCGGTGVMGWHSDVFTACYSDFNHPYMADICLARLAHERGVKIYVIPHTDSYLKHTRYNNNLFVQEHNKGFKEQTELLKTFIE